MTDREYENWEIEEDSDLTKLLHHEENGQIYVEGGMTGPHQPWEEWWPRVRKDGENIGILGPWEVDPDKGVWPRIEAVMEEYWSEDNE